MRLTVWDNQEDRWGRRVDHPWPGIAERLAYHAVGTKDGTAISVALFEGHRSAENLRLRTGVALDVETNETTGEVPPDPELIANAILARGIAAVVYTSFNHTPELPRYRIIAPLATEIDLLKIDRGVDRLIAANFAISIWKDLPGVSDRGKWGSSSIFFTGRHPPGAKPWARVIPGDPVPTDQLLVAAILGNDKRAMHAAQKAALAAASTYSPEDRALIDDFNSAHDVEELFVRYGYRKQGGHNRWRSPHQHAGSQPAVVFFPQENRWVSHSQSDQGEHVGNYSEDGGCSYGDAFALYMYYECSNNFRRALETLRGNTKAG